MRALSNVKHKQGTSSNSCGFTEQVLAQQHEELGDDRARAAIRKRE